MKKILFVVGSHRKQSFNMQVAQYVKALLDGKAQVKFLDYADMPFINQDTEFPTPLSVQNVRNEISACDGIWVFCPEYNFSYPAVVKNLFDWMSRPVKQGDTVTAIEGKKLTITGAGGKNATKNCREKLSELLKFIKGEVFDFSVGIIINTEAWVTNELVLTNEQKQKLQKQTEEFLKFID